MPGPRENVFHVVLAEPDISTLGVTNSTRPAPGTLYTETTFNWPFASGAETNSEVGLAFSNCIRYHRAEIAVSRINFSIRAAAANQ